MLNSTNQTTEDIEAWLQGLKEENSFTDSQDSAEELLPEPHFSNDEETSFSFKQLENEHLKAYLAKSKENALQPSLLVLNGWDMSTRQDTQEATRENLAYYLLPEHYQKMNGGFYLKIQNKGFAINPGPYFLEKLHEQGLTIHAIDYVIVTHDLTDNFSEIKAIYDLNIKCNHLKKSLHLISYYLHPGAYKALSTYLVPHFKQEKDCIHALEFYIDSNGLESVDLENDITLNYFPIVGDNNAKTPLGISLETHTKHASHHIGWICTPNHKNSLSLPSKLNPLDLVILTLQGAESITSASNLFQDLLTHPSMKEKRKPLLLCSFEGKKEGDNRFEMVRALKQIVQKDFQNNITILPIDRGLLVNLEELKVHCSICNTLAHLDTMQVTKSKKLFGRLHYLCSDCTL